MNSQQRLTHVDGDFVATLDEIILVVAPIQLGECRKASRAHPILEAFIDVEIGRWLILRVAIGEPRCPIGRGDDFREVIGKRLAVFFGFAWPSDSLLRKVVARGSPRWWVQQGEIAERVCGRSEMSTNKRTMTTMRTVEHRVGDQSAWVDDFVAIGRNRLAISILQIIYRAMFAIQLLRVIALNVTTVVLEKVGQLVIE